MSMIVCTYVPFYVQNIKPVPVSMRDSIVD